MDGCGCDGYASPIDDSTARRDRDRYRSHGPDRTTRMLLDMITADSPSGATVLDVGGGIGIINHELLKRGASSAVLVEASAAYLDLARREAEAAGLGDRIAILAGDFVRRAADVGAADIVTLDRVVCCYPDADALMAAASSKSRRLLGLVLPRDRWFVRWAVRLENVRWWLRRSAYRAVVHPTDRIDRLAATAGLRPRAESGTLVWRVVLYARVEPDPAA
jgi:magnesium-protoporphyrin O-methyltransferase